MTKREFLEQKRLTDPLWYAQHVGFNANGELVDPSQPHTPVEEPVLVTDNYSDKIICLADKYFKAGVLGCLAVMTIAIVVFTIKHK